jgi:transposase
VLPDAQHERKWGQLTFTRVGSAGRAGEAAWVVVRYPSPLRAFAERIRARRGAGIATVAVARKLALLFWHLLTSEQDYAFGTPA